ncbi:DUF3892 domain-containing protein [Aromatoleum evansii]|uniref:DUF3892 domain-containing protein n=1 Tax=Aromatoleum evansii TaxID=59406 RepID=UPI00388F79FE
MSRQGPYLRTHADGKWNNNLLAQAECAFDCMIVFGGSLGAATFPPTIAMRESEKSP